MKKKFRTKQLVMLILVLLITSFYYGCSKTETIESSFIFPRIGDSDEKGSSLMMLCDFTSAKNEFNINEVAIDFYYGYSLDKIRYYSSIESFYWNESEFAESEEGGSDLSGDSSYFEEDNYFLENVCLYFYKLENSNDSITFSAAEEVADYKNIGDNIFFIKEISLENFFGDTYGVQEEKHFFVTELTYNYHETITVPKEIFDSEKGCISFVMYSIYKEKDSDKTLFAVDAFVNIYYEIVDEETIRITSTPFSFGF
jgi:hypothetical protein